MLQQMNDSVSSVPERWSLIMRLRKAASSETRQRTWSRLNPGGPWFILVASAVVALPCFWQSRIQAGDLSSHVYNAWLASLVEQGKTQGLALAVPWTNLGFDTALGSLTWVFGRDVAQRVLVAVAVEIFFWGAVALARAVIGRQQWFLMPCFAMLSYGWVFHAGFFNFYFSMGCCFWAFAALWSDRRIARLAAVPLLVVATLAQALAATWAISVIVYVWLARRISRRVLLAGAALAAIVALRLFLVTHFTTYTGVRPIFLVTGADQVWIYGPKYLLLSACLLLVGILLFMQLVTEKGIAAVIRGLPFQVALLTAAGVLLIPAAIRFPAYRHALTYIADRMSLATAVSVCIVLGSANPPRALKAALAVLAAVYFCFVYADEHALNRIEDRMDAAVSTLPPGQRVVSGLIAPPNIRIDPLTHMIDRACIGRCFSYGNYEPSTGHFGLRAVAENPIVVYEYRDSFDLQKGTYMVKQRDLPLYQVYPCGAERLCIRALRAGEPSGATVTSW